MVEIQICVVDELSEPSGRHHQRVGTVWHIWVSMVTLRTIFS
jgi:hypothetical protein